ncbi:c-type cytochrome [Edaphobacter paludis]|uniref:Photosynthetic reaction center cytochrome c subunit n=1 Tax=Edaphobacter paludis TaxID=3035702 RepID=A0AAU7CYR1_9BACT
MLHGKHLSRVLIAASLLFPSVSLLAQTAPPAAPPSEAHHEMPKPTNLKVLPKNISSKDLMATMHQFTGSLGVHCNFCHVEDKTTHHLIFASDAKPEKKSARVMMRMTQTINGKYLAQLPDHGSMQKVGCGTCHRGKSTPTEFVPPPEQHGPPPAPAK